MMRLTTVLLHLVVRFFADVLPFEDELSTSSANGDRAFLCNEQRLYGVRHAS